MLPLVITLLLSGFLISGGITYLLINSPSGFGIDKADEIRKTHQGKIPRIGGLPIFIGLIICCIICHFYNEHFLENWWPVILSCTLIFIVGFIDDLYPLGAKVKLLAQVAIGCLAYYLGISVTEISNPFTSGAVSILPISLLVTVFWYVAVTNMINLIDGMDGLATGIGIFMCVTIGVIPLTNLDSFSWSEIPDGTLLSLSMAACLLGFLLFNFPPAKIFLGDGGAYLLGFFIALSSVKSSHKGSVAAALLVVMVALGLPILDTLFSIIRRAVRGMPIFRADAQHIHHRMLMQGFSKTTSLFAMYAVCGICSLVGLSILWSKGLSIPIAGSVVVLLALYGARSLGYIGNWSNLKNQFRNSIRRRKDIQYSLLQGNLLEVEVGRSQTENEFWELFDQASSKVGFSRFPKEGWNEVKIEMGLTAPWVFYVPPDSECIKVNDWKARAECFSNAYYMAVSKWPLPNETQVSYTE